MSPAYRKYLLSQAVVGAVINFPLNGATGWMLYRHLAHIPLYGRQSIAGDVVVTSLLLPALICLIATPLIRNDVRKARLPAASWVGTHSIRVARNLLLRAVVLGVVSALLVSPVVIWTLHALGVEGLGLWTFVGSKATFGAMLAAVITPIVAVWGLEDGTHPAGS